ncbi:MAG: glycosyltransferase family 2 protein [Nitrospira sp.]|nr:glycosyltransferase family 2 protein [bacterium]MBL7047983.1 glycosyltransferase family 2 protein [Nitrospira sp.]
MSQPLDLVISIVNYNTRDLLDQCLNSIYALGLPLKFEVWIADNSSGDNSVEMVESKYPEARVIRSAGNPGYGYANNRIIERTESRYVLVLNPDIIVQAGSIESVIGFMDANSDTAVCGSKLLNPDNTLQYSCRRYPEASTILLRGLGIDRLSPESDNLRHYMMMDWAHDEPADVDWVMGSCMFIRREALKDTGMFDEKYFMYYEDVDLCIRLWKNWRVCYVPDSCMIHYHMQQSHKLTSFRQRYIHIKSALRFFRLHGMSPVRTVHAAVNIDYKKGGEVL